MDFNTISFLILHYLLESDAGRDWGQEEKGITEDKMAGWHHWLDARESEWTPGDGDGQGGQACCDSWGCKESDTTERLNWTEHCKWIEIWVGWLQLFEEINVSVPYSYWKHLRDFQKSHKKELKLIILISVKECLANWALSPLLSKGNE